MSLCQFARPVKPILSATIRESRILRVSRDEAEIVAQSFTLLYRRIVSGRTWLRAKLLKELRLAD